MTHTFIYKQTGIALACALALSLLSGPASAQLNPAEQSGYIHDTRGPAIMSAYGLCWHSGTGLAPIPGVECGGTPAPVAQVVRPAPPPAYIAPAPAPAPVAAYTSPPAPKPVAERLMLDDFVGKLKNISPETIMTVGHADRLGSERLTLDADTLFNFDKSVLRPAGRDTLDDFVGKLKDISPETIMAVGHADRLGSERYNQRLSEQRVEAVKAYLVGRGIEPSRISTTGKGKTQPVTKAGECQGGKSAKIIACLQPDRRVEIEIIGTQINR